MKRKIFTVIIALIFVLGVKAQKESVVEVRGTASLKAIPKIASLQIPISVEMKEYKECSDSLMKKLNILQKELKKIGVDEKQLKSTGFSIQEDFSYNNGREKDGYKGFAQMLIKDQHDSPLLKEVIQVLRAHETTYTLAFILSKEQKDSLTAKLIEIAVEDATQKARMLAKASKIILGDIVEIKYGENYSYGGDNFLLQEVVYSDSSQAPSYNVVQQLNLTPKEVSLQKGVLIKWAIDY